jgi:transposase
MCDALSRNVPKEHDVILMNCIAHARRKFVEVEQFFPDECAYVIEQLADVYRHDAYIKDCKVDDVQRLRYHQTHSGPIMQKLKYWLQRQLEDNLIEENNSLGKAIRYTLKHWEPLTHFLKTEGAPLDNNIVEASLKVPIRIRKNAMFYKTEHGAFIGSMLISIIQTCQANKVNPVEYLAALQANKSQVFKEPAQWLPWNYYNHISPQAVAQATA